MEKTYTAAVNRQSLLEHALRGIDAQISELAKRSVEIQQELRSYNVPIVSGRAHLIQNAESLPGKKYRHGLAATKAIAEASNLTYEPEVHKPAKRHSMTPEGRKRISAAQKKRWAAKRKEDKNAAR